MCSAQNVSPQVGVGRLGRLADFGRKHRLIVSSWNVEGLTDIKLYEICSHMRANSIDILCMQETRKSMSNCFMSHYGFEVFLSGRGDATAREWAGVGFIVAPQIRDHMIASHPVSNRVASLCVRTSGGCVAITSVYAPHNLKPLAEKFQFYE